MSAERPAQRVLTMATLVLAGEIIFALPFHVPRFFRPTMLSVFGLDNAGLGDVFAIYGVMAMLAYFPGGLIADRVAPRTLLASSLALTALGGIALVVAPQVTTLRVVYGWWGVTTILLFWAAMLRATSMWGGQLGQGRAFGVLDGGRGVAAAVAASVGVALLARVGDGGARDDAFFSVVIFYVVVTGAMAFMCLLVLPRGHAEASTAHRPSAADVVVVIRRPAIWAIAVVVVAAYCGYKGLDNVGLYLKAALGYDDVESSSFVTAAAWLRLPAAVGAGVVADRVGGARVVVVVAFAVMAVCCGVLGAGVVVATPAVAVVVLGSTLAVTFGAVYVLRGVYFALVRDKAPLTATGTAIGVVSVIGFTPDVFFGSAIGRVLDSAPGVVGHERAFFLLAAVAVAGGAAAALLRPPAPQQ